MDFGAIPPEINSVRMYTGVGSGPMLAAAWAWDALAVELHSSAALYTSAIEGMTVGPWQGPASVSMMSAAAPYAAWMIATATGAEQASMQANAAAAAYEAAFVATVPPPAVAANRSLLLALIATNIFGQNTPAIAATEAEYVEMWAQDAAAMYAYAASSAAAAELTPFSSPPETINPAGAASQSAAVAEAVGAATGSELQSALSQLVQLMPGMLQSLATTPSAAQSAAAATPVAAFIDAIYPITASLRPVFAAITGAYSPIGGIIVPGGWWLFGTQILGLAQNAPGVAELLSSSENAIAGGLAPLRGGYISSVTPSPGAVSGSMGHATLVGSLSVPEGWVSAAPVMRTVASIVPSGGLSAASAAPAAAESGMFGEMAMASLAGRALAGAGIRTVGSGAKATGNAADDVATTATIIVVPAD